MTDRLVDAPTPTAADLRSIVPQFTVPDVVRTAEYYREVQFLGNTACGKSWCATVMI
jgi:hypothetical protein